LSRPSLLQWLQANRQALKKSMTVKATSLRKSQRCCRSQRRQTLCLTSIQAGSAINLPMKLLAPISADFI